MFRTSCKVVQRNNKKRKKKLIPKSTKLFFKPKHIWMIMEPCVALKKKKETYVFISLFTWTFTVLQTSVKARPVREAALCIFNFFIILLFLNDALSTEVAAKSHWSVEMWDWWRLGGWGVNSAYSLAGWGVYGLGGPTPAKTPLLLPAGFGVTLWPAPPALWPVFRWGCDTGGGRGWGWGGLHLVLDVLIRMHC